MPTATVNGIEIAYEVAGSGPRLLFVNGSGTTMASTGMLTAPLAGSFELLRFDQRGLGQTSIPPGPYAMADYAADALGLLDAVGWDTCRVVGISFGGMVALELAVTAPARLERLALLCTSAGGAGGSSYPLHELAALSPADRARIHPEIMDTRITPEWLAEHPSDRAFVELLAARDEQPKPDDVRRGEAEQLDARRRHDTWDRLGAIACPTLVAAGRHDGVAPLANSEAIATAITGADLRVYEGGHLFLAQDPRAFPDIVSFLSTP